MVIRHGKKGDREKNQKREQKDLDIKPGPEALALAETCVHTIVGALFLNDGTIHTHSCISHCVLGYLTPPLG